MVGGQVSPVRTMALRKILLSFSSFVQFIIIWLNVCSSFILQGHVELGINLNRGYGMTVIKGGGRGVYGRLGLQ